jgi:hypothetical protein
MCAETAQEKKSRAGNYLRVLGWVQTKELLLLFVVIIFRLIGGCFLFIRRGFQPTFYRFTQSIVLFRDGLVGGGKFWCCFNSYSLNKKTNKIIHL